MKRRTITIYDYKDRPCTVPLPKDGGWWWGPRVGSNLGTNHCVISCYNHADVVYITDYGLARIAYCDSHAITRILRTIITGELERGIWCQTNNGKLVPHYYYKQYLPYMKALHPNKAKRLEEKLLLIKTEKHA